LPRARPLLHAWSLGLRRKTTPLLVAAIALAGCARFGDLGGGVRGVLAEDARHLAPGDAAGPGPDDVVAEGVRVEGMAAALYRPRALFAPAPAVVFLPGLLAPEAQYESYARALASWGFVVAVRGRYGPWYGDEALAADASTLARWLVTSGLADSRSIAVAGHSMGGKDAILAAVRSPDFAAVVAIDPDDGGRQPSVVRGVVERLRAPLLLVGAELGWRGADVCAPRDRNYQRFFERSPRGTVEVTLRGADHVQVMDDADAFGQFVCRTGTADSRAVRTLARRATVGFLLEHLRGAKAMVPMAVAGMTVRVK
jgi:dienelactone hydrolase